MSDSYEDPRAKVSRARRFGFIAVVTAFCLLTALVLVIYASFFVAPLALADGATVAFTTPLLDLYVKSALSLATATVLAYVTGSVVDYNGGVGNLMTRDTSPKG